jgi:hypothetical protein
MIRSDTFQGKPLSYSITFWIRVSQILKNN